MFNQPLFKPLKLPVLVTKEKGLDETQRCSSCGKKTEINKSHISETARGHNDRRTLADYAR